MIRPKNARLGQHIKINQCYIPHLELRGKKAMIISVDAEKGPFINKMK